MGQGRRISCAWVASLMDKAAALQWGTKARRLQLLLELELSFVDE